MHGHDLPASAARRFLIAQDSENENSDFILMLNQAGGDREILAKKLNISPHQLSYVTQSSEGERLYYESRLRKPTFITLAAGLFVAESAA